jgi:hypothetical protein
MSFCNILLGSGVFDEQAGWHGESRPTALRGALRRWVEKDEL